MTAEATGSGGDRIYPTVGSAVAATARPSLELFDLPYPFSQVGLLTPTEFAKLAEQRRSRAGRSWPPVNEQVLEELHRAGVLVPLFRVDLVATGDAPGIDLSTSLSAKHLHTSLINEVLRGAAEGRVIDPSMVDFEPWPRERRRSLWPTVDSGYLYSRHQLLGLDVAMAFVVKLRGHREDHRAVYELEDTSWPNAPTRGALASWRSLAIGLSALDTYYWPQLTHMLRGDFKMWRSAMTDFDPPTMLDWLGLTLGQFEPQLISLLATASFYDDTGKFYELSMARVPAAWRHQTQPGGLILVNLYRELGGGALAASRLMPTARHLAGSSPTLPASCRARTSPGRQPRTSFPITTAQPAVRLATLRSPQLSCATTVSAC